MRYDSFQYLWPPRPEKAFPPALLPTMEKKGWVAQAKKNGACSIIAVSPERQITAMNRHNEAHQLWSPTRASSAAFQNLPGAGWYVFEAELLHSKVRGGPRDTNFVHDILVADGASLVGANFTERQALLKALFLSGEEDETASHYVINANTWLAKNVRKGFGAFFRSLDKPEDEGVVLKRPEAVLNPCVRASANSAWQIKCRRPHANYRF